MVCARMKVLWMVCLLFFYRGHCTYSLHLGHIRVFLLFLSGDGYVPERTNSTNLGSCFPERGTVAGLFPFLSSCAQFFQTRKFVCEDQAESDLCFSEMCLHQTSQSSNGRSHIMVKYRLVWVETTVRE